MPVTAPRRSGYRPDWNRRIPSGEVCVKEPYPGESLRSSPGYIPLSLRDRIHSKHSARVSYSLATKYGERCGQNVNGLDSWLFLAA
jgi:hypothetical protein